MKDFFAGVLLSTVLWVVAMAAGYIHMERAKIEEHEHLYRQNYSQRKEINKANKERNIAWNELNRVIGKNAKKQSGKQKEKEDARVERHLKDHHNPRR